ncbi:Clp protease N-terminal domain-containing protein [Streptomyces sp. NPDC056835]|uniref:Clp protease N-terminal domain-containing protein n=1 Tax=Streptomyces sp. NPDC056835 TaxID=3345956 RepID=UPI0036BADA9C
MENHPQLTSVITEFEIDVIELLVETLQHAVKCESRTVGTEDLLAALVMGDSAAGEAVAPGMRRAGELSGMIRGRAGRGWASDDHDDEASGEPADEHEVAATWRVAQWQTAMRARKTTKASKTAEAAEAAKAAETTETTETVAQGDQEWPEPSGALRACLFLALGLARLEASPGVYARHVARALLDLPDSRAREAYALRQLDRAAAYAALDALDARESPAAPATDRPLSHAATVLRRAGLLEDRSNWLARKVMAWTTQHPGDGTSMLFAVTVEASRQAVRCGRSAVEPVHLLLAVLALDRSLSLAGRSLPAEVAATNGAADLLRTHGVRPDALALSAVAADPSPVPDEVPLSAAAERTFASARLIAAEHHASSAGTVHLLAALLDDVADDEEGDEEGEEESVSRRLRAHGVDPIALRADLAPRLSA